MGWLCIFSPILNLKNVPQKQIYFLLMMKMKRCAVTRIFFVPACGRQVLGTKKENPVFVAFCSISGFVIPKYTAYLFDNQIFELIMKVPL